MEPVYRALVRHARTVIGLVAALTVLFGVFAARVEIDSSVETLVEPGDPDLLYYEEVKQTFGSEEIDVVAMLADDVFTAATLGKIAQLSDRLEKVRGVEKVTSLSTVRRLAAAPDGSIDTSPLMEEVPSDADGIARLKKAVYANPLFVNQLVSADGRAAALTISYDEMSDAEFARSGIHTAVEHVLAETAGPERIYLTGLPTLKVKSAEVLRSDMLTFTPLTVLAILVVLLFFFRTPRGVLVPLATTGVGLVWTLGLMGYLGIPIDVVTLVLPTLLTAVGSAYSIHVVARYYEEVDVGGERDEIVIRVVRHLGLPVFVTAFTTVLGFASLIMYRVQAIQHFGVFSVFGITVLFGLALAFASAILVVLRIPPGRSGRRQWESAWLVRSLEAFGRFDIRHRRAITAVSLALLAACAWGIRFVRVDTNYLSYFPEGTPVREASRVIGEHLGGTVSFLVVIEGPEENSITRLDTLQRMAALQDFIDRLPNVDKTVSLVDYVKLLHRVFHDDDPAYFGLPDTDAAVRQYLLLLDPETIEDVVTVEFSQAAILVRSGIDGSTELADAISKIRRFAADAFPAEFSVRPTGTQVLLNRTADDLAEGQLQSLLGAVAVVFVVMSVMFLSLRFGLVAMVPNLIPIFIFFGLLGWGGISLSLSTAVIASIALGLGVDEAVHLLAEFNHAVRRHPDQEEAVLAALRSVGPPVVYTTVALFLGFLVPMASSFVPVRHFGLLSAVNVGTSLLADLVLLPALLVSTRFVTLWDVLALKLGREPHETIPLFRGLRPSQARIAALMGVLKTVGRGENIIVQDEPGSEMYVVISGRAEARRTVDGRLLALGMMGRGDVIGEMGLLRSRPRTADVIALEETELLVVNERFLRVLQHRYPRIASTVFFNLTHILSDRLQQSNERLVASVAGDRGGPV